MIESPQNKKILHAKQLLQYSKKRQEHQQAVIDSKVAFSHILAQFPDRITYILYHTLDPKFLASIQASKRPHFQVSEQVFKSLTQVKQSFGAIAIVSTPEPPTHIEKESNSLGIFSINNPSNLGSILRNMHAFSCKQLFLIDHCCDWRHPDCLRASAGHLFDITIHTLSSSELSLLREAFTLIQVDSNAHTPLASLEIKQPSLFLFGSEQGFPKDCPKSDISCTIPMTKSCDSLNISVASGIVLYEASRGNH